MNKITYFIIIVLACTSCSSISSMEVWGNGDETVSSKYEFLKESTEEPLNLPENLELIESEDHYPYFSNFEIDENTEIPKTKTDLFLRRTKFSSAKKIG